MISRLEHDSLFAIEWFKNNKIALNQDKWNLIVSEVFNFENVFASVGQSLVWETENQKLGITIDRKLNINDCVTSICKRSWEKIIFIS